MQYKLPFFLAILIFFSAVNIAVSADNRSSTSYIPGVVVITINSDLKAEISTEKSARLGIDNIDRYLDSIGAVKVERKFPHCLPPKPGGADLTVIYNLFFPEIISVEQVCKEMSAINQIKYAEPWYIAKVFLDHNDPHRNLQYGLNLCQANRAHDISTGDPSVPIGVIDTGTDMNHPDLEDNLWINPGEDLNGDGTIQNNERNDEDDDDNGYVDDFYGWDYYSDDSNPDDRSGHGTHVSGICSAVTNNRTGVASVAYSCSIMPVRTGHGLNVTHGYEGIEYAATMGAKVINCSWGGSQDANWARSVIQYAYDNDALVIASAGNEYSDEIEYPAGYEHAVAVAATDNQDHKPAFSNYGEWVDISAPGVDILSTIRGGDYGYMDGTSMSSPFTASVAALIRAAFPRLDVDNARRLLIDGADNIDDVNNQYRGRLGSGRINAYRSLLLGLQPILQIEELEIVDDDNGDNHMDPGERVEIAITISNDEIAEMGEEIYAILSCEDPNVTIQGDFIDFPDLEGGDSYTNDEEPFVVTIREDIIPKTTYFTVNILAQPGDFSISKKFEIVIGHPGILIVDDDDGDEFENIYFGAVESTGKGWVRWDVANVFAPEPETLTEYDMVLWVTGNSNPPLDPLDRFQMEGGLSSGANIWLIGQFIGDDDENADLLRNYFGARHEADVVPATTVLGIPDRPVSGDTELLIFGSPNGGDGRLSPSDMSITRGSDSLFVYKRGNEITGLAGVYREDQISGSKTVYLGFAFEAVNDHQETTSKSEVIEQLYAWFTGNWDDVDINVPTPVEYYLDAAYPNPFNSSIRLGFAIPYSGPYELKIVDLTGRIQTVLGSGKTTAGYHYLSWYADGSPSGVYLARLTVPGLTPLDTRLILLK